MKNSIKITTQKFIVILAIAFSPILCFGQSEGWHIYKTAPEILIPIQMESTNDGTIYILTKDRKMYYREVDATAWTQIENVLAFWNVTTFAVHPITKRLFIGTGAEGIQMTDNYGDTWQHEYFFTIPNSGNHQGIYSIEIDLENNMIIMGGGVNVSTVEWKVYRSFNNGNSWQAIDVPTTFSQMHISTENRILASNEINGLFLSEDNGLNWTNIGMQNVFMTDFAEDSNGAIYAAVQATNTSSGPGVYISNDGGLNWAVSNSGLGNTEVSCVAYGALNDEILLGTFDGLYRLNDQMWELVETPYLNPVMRDVHLLDSDIYMCSELGGVDKKELTQSTWTTYNDGFKGGVTDFLFNSTGTLYATNITNSGYFGINEPFQNWERYGLPEESFSSYHKVIKMEKAPSGDIFFLDFDELFRSTDGGVSFENITPILPLVPNTAYHRFDKLDVGVDDHIMLHQFSDNTIYLSVDNGANFQILLDQSDDEVGVAIVETMLNSESLGYLVVIRDFNFDKKILRSEDGEIWHQIDLSSLPPNSINFELSLDLMNNGQVVSSFGHKPYYVNTDETFTEINVPWTQINPNSYYDFRADANGGFCITIFPTFSSIDYEGVWRSQDNGQNWENLGFPTDENGQEIYSTGLNFNTENVPFIISDDNIPGNPNDENDVAIYYFGQEGVFTSLDDLIASNRETHVYPNPVGPNGVFTIENSGISVNTKFTCFDLQGGKVQVKVEVGKETATVSLNALPKGIYFLELSTNTDTYTVKFIVS